MNKCNSASSCLYQDEVEEGKCILANNLLSYLNRYFLGACKHHPPTLF